MNLEGIKMLEYKYDTQLLIEGKDLDEDEINDYFRANFKGDCLLAVGDEELIKIHFHTNEPWKVLEYCSQLGEIYDIVVEDMDRQARGKGKHFFRQQVRLDIAEQVGGINAGTLAFQQLADRKSTRLNSSH